MENKRVKLYYWLFLLIGSFTIGVSSGYYHWEKWIKYLVFAIWLIILMWLLIGINFLWYKKLSKELSNMSRILVEEGNVELFLEENDRLLKDKKSKQLQSIYKINQSVASCYKDEFDIAEEYLEQVVPKSLIPVSRAVYFSDLAWVKMNLGKIQEAVVILHEHEKLLSDMRKVDETLDTLLLMMEVKESIFNKDFEKAKLTFSEVKEREIPYNEKDIRKLECELQEGTSLQ